MGKTKYTAFHKTVHRTPLLSFDRFEKILNQLNNQENDISAILKDQTIQEAIYLGSPVLHEEILKYQDSKITDPKEIESLKYSVLRYLTRMSTRCTPFGLFAGFGVGSIEENTDINLNESNRNDRHTRLDMNYLCALSQDIAKIPVIKQAIRFYPNTSIYVYGEHLRFVEYKYVNKNRVHNIISVDDSEYLQEILEKAKMGARIVELAELLVDDEITIEFANSFIEELIDCQLLVNELEPAVTGEEFFGQLFKVLTQIEGIDSLKENLQKLNDLILKIDSNPIGLTLDLYNQIVDVVKELNSEFELKYLFQSDMRKTASKSVLSQQIVDDIRDGLAFLNRITPKPQNNTILSKFAESFYERYEDRPMQLLKVLDTETGIGYNPNSRMQGDINPLIDDIGAPRQNAGGMEIQWNGIQSVMLQKLLKANAKNAYQIELTDKDFEGLKPDWDDLPSTISAMCEVFSYNDEEKLIYLSSAGGSSAANLLGRFCHADEELHQYVLEITQKEEELNPAVIYAEVVHLPESRIGNILLRPVLRKYEIPYLAKSGVEHEFQLPLSDLFIKVQQNKVFLFSKRLNKQIIPRLSTAHNYSYGSMPVYHFLCDLQAQGIRGGLYFSWGSLENEFQFLPRVKYKNMVFSLARWIIKKEDFKPFIEEKDDTTLVEKINEWRESLKIPRYSVLADGDNELFVDFERAISVKTLISVIKKRPSFILKEFPFSKSNAIVKDVNGEVYTNQIVLAFYKDNN
jgi:hypothetical protein